MEPEYIDGELSGSDLESQLAEYSRLLTPAGHPFIQSGSLIEENAMDDAAMSVDFVVVTRSKELNRNGSRVQIVAADGRQGILTKNYAANPVMLWNHGYGGVPFPIGQSEDKSGKLTLKSTASKMLAKGFFSQSLPEAAQIYALISEGIIRTCSISFIPLFARRFKAKAPKTDEEEYDFKYASGWDFTESDMIEWSPVAIPADPGAVRKMLETGRIATERITQGMKPSLVAMAGEKPVWSPGMNFDVRKDDQDERPAPVSPYSIRIEEDGKAVTLGFPTSEEFEAKAEEVAAAFRSQNVDAETESSETPVDAGLDLDELDAGLRARRQDAELVQVAELIPDLIAQSVGVAVKPLHDAVSEMGKQFAEATGKVVD